jgi:hypothetical protein
VNEDDIGKVFLLAMKWDWTWVGRFAGIENGRIILEQAGYFSRTGQTFGLLCKNGFNEQTQFHPVLTDGGRVRLEMDPNVILEWAADWPQPTRRAR